MCPGSLNRSICRRACSSAVSFRLDSISAIPLTFSTKRLQEKTSAPTRDTHTHTHFYIQHSHKQAGPLSHINIHTGCPLGMMSDVANSVNHGSHCQVFHSPSSTQPNQIKACLCTILTSYSLCKFASPPPSAHSLQLLWLPVKEDIHPNWCTPT